MHCLFINDLIGLLVVLLYVYLICRANPTDHNNYCTFHLRYMKLLSLL